MNDQTPHHQPENSRSGAHDFQKRRDLALRIVLGSGVLLTAVVVLKFAGGSLSVTPTGLMLNVNAPQ